MPALTRSQKNKHVNVVKNRGIKVIRTTGEQAQATYGEQMQTTYGEQMQTTSGEQAQATTGEQAQATTGEQAQATSGEQAQATSGEQMQTTYGEQMQTTYGGEPPNDKQYLANKHSHIRDEVVTTVKLDAPKFIYGIKPNSSGFISPSKFIHHFAAPFNADAIIAKIIANGNPKYDGMTAIEIKSKWDRESKLACNLGTQMHNAIELYYNNVPGIKKATAWEGLDAECSQFDEFITFQENAGLTPYRTEWQVFDEDTHLRGFIDMVFKNKAGNYEIYDWKRVKEIKKSGFSALRHSALCHLGDCNYWHYTIQLNLYKYILESNYDMKIDGMYLVAFYPGKSLERHECPSLFTELKEVFDSFN